MIDRRALLEATLSAAAGLAGRSSFDMPDRDTEERPEALLAAMTLDERIGQMTLVGNVTLTDWAGDPEQPGPG